MFNTRQRTSYPINTSRAYRRACHGMLRMHPKVEPQVELEVDGKDQPTVVVEVGPLQVVEKRKG